MGAEHKYEELIWLAKMLWYFQRIISVQLSKTDDEATFRAYLYKNINPETAKAVIAATHGSNRDIHKISTSANRLSIHILRNNAIDKVIMAFEDT